MTSTVTRCLLIFLMHRLGSATPSTCVLEGVPDLSSRTTHHLPAAVKDTYRGILAVFPTRNIQRVKIRENKYFNVTWNDQKLVLATGPNFENYELETGYTVKPSISLVLHFDCTQDQEKDFVVVQTINDTNNHDPLLGQKDYAYVFGMTVPKGFVFTDLIPIKAFDHDVSNGQIYFEIPQNDFVQIQRKGVPRSYSLKEFSTKLVASKDLVSFHQQFTLLVTDSGNPPRRVSSTITIKVGTPRVPRRVFRKNLYYARYKAGGVLEMQEKIVCNEADVILRQRGYENYFNITLLNSEVIVNNVKPLTLDGFKLDFIAIEVDALDRSFQRLRGRTAIIVQLPQYIRSGNEFILFGVSSKLTVFSITTVMLILLGLLLNKLYTFLLRCLSKKKTS